jgi:hypothetical protein
MGTGVDPRKTMDAQADLKNLARVSRVTSAMAQLLGKLGLARRGHPFYALRHASRQTILSDQAPNTSFRVSMRVK